MYTPTLARDNLEMDGRMDGLFFGTDSGVSLERRGWEKRFDTYISDTYTPRNKYNNQTQQRIK